MTLPGPRGNRDWWNDDDQDCPVPIARGFLLGFSATMLVAALVAGLAVLVWGGA